MLAKLNTFNMIIGIVVGVLGTVVSITIVWNFFFSPYQIEGYALSVEAPMPPKLLETLKGLHQFSAADIRKRFSRDPDYPVIRDETLEAAIPVFSKIIKDRLTWNLKVTNNLTNHLTVITIRNAGRKTARNVQVQMQYVKQGSVILDRGDGKREIVDFGGISKLGDVPPRSEFNIYLYSSLPFLGGGVVTHDEGIAEISEYRPIPPLVARTGGVFISYYWTTVALSVIVGCLVILFLLRFVKNRKA